MQYWKVAFLFPSVESFDLFECYSVSMCKFVWPDFFVIRCIQPTILKSFVSRLVIGIVAAAFAILLINIHGEENIFCYALFCISLYGVACRQYQR